MGSSTRPTCTDGKLSVPRRTIGSVSALDGFSPATRDWFRGAFAAPTAAQEGAWAAAQAGRHALVVAPTGSGKTLAAFLWALDRLAADEPTGRSAAPLPGPVRLAAQGAGRRRAAQPPRAAHRDPAGGAAGRRATARHHGRDAHRRHPGGRAAVVRAHAAGRAGHHARIALPAAHLGRAGVAARGAHGDPGRGARGRGHQARRAPRVVAGAARRAARCSCGTAAPGPGPAHRPVGDGPAAGRGRDLPGRGAAGRGGPAAHPEDDRGGRRGAGAGPRGSRRTAGAGLVGRGGHRLGGRHGAAAVDLARGGAAAAGPRPAAPVDDRVRQLPAAGRAADCSAQRACGRGVDAEEIDEAVDLDTVPSDGGARIEHFPAEAVGQSGIGGGAPPVVAKAHHGSMAREQRTIVEEELKAGLLPCVVATSSLELGIDMGAVDLVVQVEAPPSVASGLQRVGRAGHQVGAVSRGIVFPKYRGDLVSCAVVAERMTSGGIESTRYPRNPLDVLAQHVVAMVALDAVDRRRPGRGGTAGRPVRRAARHRTARGARHAVRSLPVRGVRRAAGADHLGPGDG